MPSFKEGLYHDLTFRGGTTFHSHFWYIIAFPATSGPPGKQEKLSYEEFLLNLSEAEVQARQENGRKRRLREAKFPILKPMETFSFEAAPELDVRLMKELSNCDYVKKSRNVIFVGKSGTGKTHLATALGMEACKQGVRTRALSPVVVLPMNLFEARDEKLLGRAVKRYAGYGLLIIDELGYVPFSKEGSQLIFQILAERHERKPVIDNHQYGFWRLDANIWRSQHDRGAT